MNVTKEIISDLLPLYVANECSRDTRALVEEYLQQHPDEARELRAIMTMALPKATLPTKDLTEAKAFREARRRLRRRSWLMGLAIFFSLAPFSYYKVDFHSSWLLRDSPLSALVYAACGALLWILYFIERKRARSL
jgi:ferric-dicitrate binding protein FerR (iron transport regulator)